MSITKVVGGRPVTGELPTSRRRPRAEQKSIEGFVAALDELFAFPQVEAVRWTQYTPSFNDGDPCVFTTGEFTVKLEGVEEGDEDEEESYERGGFRCEYGVNNHFSTFPEQFSYRAKHPIAEKMDEHFDYKHVEAFYDALEDAFGDPAEVTATRDGFHIEDYEVSY